MMWVVFVLNMMGTVINIVYNGNTCVWKWLIFILIHNQDSNLIDFWYSIKFKAQREWSSTFIEQKSIVKLNIITIKATVHKL